MLVGFFHNAIDQQIAVFFTAHRGVLGVKVFSIITNLGNWQIVAVMAAIVITVLIVRKKEGFVAPFLAVIAGTEAVTFVGKLLFHRPRPLLAVFHPTDFSFPSGHASIAAAFYGYLAFILVRLLPERYRWPIVIFASLLIIAVAFSRIYLGVHYLSDVIGGLAIGLVALAVGIRFRRFPS